ncbi:unnamed protein product [Ectocarpus sp. 8 AP-2014]
MMVVAALLLLLLRYPAPPLLSRVVSPLPFLFCPPPRGPGGCPGRFCRRKWWNDPTLRMNDCSRSSRKSRCVPLFLRQASAATAAAALPSSSCRLQSCSCGRRARTPILFC